MSGSPLSTCYVGEVRQHGLLLGFGGFTEQRLLGATPVLGEALREAACASPCTGLARISRTG